jgi:transcriptional antiterminator RfaH
MQAQNVVWYVAQTNPNCEERAKLGLRSKGFRAFVPELTKWARIGKRRERTQRPLFVRYVLVGLASDNLAFGAIRDTDGVQSLVGVTGTPIPISSAFVNELALAVVSGAFDTTIKPRKAGYRPGEKVRIAKGPFAELVGEIKWADNQRRVEIMFSMLGRETIVVADAAQLRAA